MRRGGVFGVWVSAPEGLGDESRVFVSFDKVAIDGIMCVIVGDVYHRERCA